MTEELKSRIGSWILSCYRFFMRRLYELRFPGKPWPWEELGPAGERLGARYLRKRGYRILEKGHRQRRGEIDLIALDGKTIVFVEVKTRSTSFGGHPFEAVDARKQERLSRAALIYLKKHRVLESPTRFDVLSIMVSAGELPDIRHIENAFDAIGHGQMFR